MKIAIVGRRFFGAGNVQTQAIINFLVSKGYTVKTYYYDSPFTKKEVWRHRIKRRFDNLTMEERIINNMEKEIRDGDFDVIISAELNDILKKDLNCLKIFSFHTPLAHENYYTLTHRHPWGNGYSLNDIKKLQEEELDIFRKTDYIIVAWKCVEEYLRKYIYDGENIISNSLGGWWGCNPQEKTVPYYFPTSIIYLGGLERYYNNMDLLSKLTSNASHLIDCYGQPKPSEKYKLRFKGTPATLDIFYDYQFGLNTISKEKFRHNIFSAKILNYLSYGLPCLFPEWQKFPHELGGCIPYNEDNFIDVVDKYSEKKEWQKLSGDAIKQANNLKWERVLEPLAKLIEKG